MDAMRFDDHRWTIDYQLILFNSFQYFDLYDIPDEFDAEARSSLVSTLLPVAVFANLDIVDLVEDYRFREFSLIFNKISIAEIENKFQLVFNCLVEELKRLCILKPKHAITFRNIQVLLRNQFDKQVKGQISDNLIINYFAFAHIRLENFGQKIQLLVDLLESLSRNITTQNSGDIRFLELTEKQLVLLYSALSQSNTFYRFLCWGSRRQNLSTKDFTQLAQSPQKFIRKLFQFKRIPEILMHFDFQLPDLQLNESSSFQALLQTSQINQKLCYCLSRNRSFRDKFLITDFNTALFMANEILTPFYSGNLISSNFLCCLNYKNVILQYLANDAQAYHLIVQELKDVKVSSELLKEVCGDDRDFLLFDIPDSLPSIMIQAIFGIRNISLRTINEFQNLLLLYTRGVKLSRKYVKILQFISNNVDRESPQESVSQRGLGNLYMNRFRRLLPFRLQQYLLDFSQELFSLKQPRFPMLLKSLSGNFHQSELIGFHFEDTSRLYILNIFKKIKNIPFFDFSMFQDESFYQLSQQLENVDSKLLQIEMKTSLMDFNLHVLLEEIINIIGSLQPPLSVFKLQELLNIIQQNLISIEIVNLIRSELDGKHIQLETKDLLNENVQDIYLAHLFNAKETNALYSNLLSTQLTYNSSFKERINTLLKFFDLAQIDFSKSMDRIHLLNAINSVKQYRLLKQKLFQNTYVYLYLFEIYEPKKLMSNLILGFEVSDEVIVELLKTVLLIPDHEAVSLDDTKYVRQIMIMQCKAILNGQQPSLYWKSLLKEFVVRMND